MAGLNAVDTIQKIGNRVTSATSSPRPFSPARRIRRDLIPLALVHCMLVN